MTNPLIMMLNFHLIFPVDFSSRPLRALATLLFVCGALLAAPISAQSPAVGPAPATAQSPVAPPPAAPAAPKPTVPPAELSSLSWLEGCWRGEVAQYEFREHWLPLRGGLMVGAAHVVFQGKSQEFEYLRLETRPDGVYYIAIPSGKKETPFKLTTVAVEDMDTIFTFTNPIDEYPQRIIYRRGIDGWLYATVEGKTGSKEQKVIYPMRRIDCQTGSFIRK